MEGRGVRPGLQRDINQEPAQGKSHLGKLFSCFGGRVSSFAASRSFRPLVHSHYCSASILLYCSFPSLNALTVPVLWVFQGASSDLIFFSNISSCPSESEATHTRQGQSLASPCWSWAGLFPQNGAFPESCPLQKLAFCSVQPLAKR